MGGKRVLTVKWYGRPPLANVTCLFVHLNRFNVVKAMACDVRIDEIPPTSIYPKYLHETIP